MAKRKMDKKLKELFDKKIPVYSFSKLDSWDSCKYNWLQSYVLKNKSKDNIYSGIGEVTHDSLQAVYEKKETLLEAKQKFNDALKELEDKGIKFPANPPTTKPNYIKNMSHFYDNYTVLDTKMINEQFVLYKIPRFENAINDEDFIWIQMYIDSIIPVYEDGEFKSVIVNDWKTSSKFDKEKLRKASKQLLIYKLGIEQSTGVPVTKIGWSMLKFVYCCYNTKGSKTKPSETKKSMQERKDSVKYFYKKIIADLIQDGMDTMEAEMLTAKAINHNDFTLLPQYIQDKYWIEDCFLECNFTDEMMEECKQWIINTVKIIESIDTDDIREFPPVEIIRNETDYFCFNLCGRPDCIHLLKYKSDNANNFQKDKKEDKIRDELGITAKKINLDSLFK